MTQNNTINDHQVEQQEEEIDESNCVRCQKPATFMCSSCGIIGPRYCSIECQKLHWKTDHYLTCKATQLRQQQEENRRISVANNNNNNNNINPFNEQGQPVIESNNDIELNDVRRSTNNETNTNNLDSEEFADNLKFYMQQIYLIIKPVVMCIVLSIFWVKVGFSDGSDYSPTRPTYTVLSSNNAGSSTSSGSSSSGSSSSGLTSLANAGIIIGQIIIVTVVIVFFFRKGWIKVLIGFFMLVVLFLLGFMTYLLILNLIQVFYIPLDYITLSIALWNFVVVGLLSIFWKGPLWLQQAYLTVLSSLMAFSLTGLEQWTTWILLGLLAVWDLIAVLCPFGPLRLLIESSRNQQREVPALLYSVNAVWFMLASSNHMHPTTNEYVSISMKKDSVSVSSLNDIGKFNNNNNNNYNHNHVQQLNNKPSIQSMGSFDHYQPSTISSIAPINQYSSSTLMNDNQSKSTIDAQNDLDNHHSNNNNTSSSMMVMSANHHERISHDGYIRLQEDRLQSNNYNDDNNNMIPTNNSLTTINNNLSTNNNNNNNTSDIRRRSTDGRNNNNNSNENIPTDNQINSTEEIRDEEDVERSGLKLGLGDFVFYSVLVARAAMYDWITTVCCTIAVLTGLTATIFLLAIYKKALPALPISIAFGILFYFVAKTVLVPYVTICVLAMVGL